MARRRTTRQRLATQALELSIVAPQVAAQRLARLAVAGLQPTARDRRELVRMNSEKLHAFYESWAAMWTHAWRAQLQTQRAVAAALAASASGKTPASALAALSTGTAKLAAAGLAPVHRKAVANAKRLSRRRTT